MILVRPERPDDHEAIHAVNASAFPTEAEAQLVDALRDGGRLTLSLVAESDGRVVGHVAFSPVTLENIPIGLGLAPLAVVPGHQRQGIGERLVREGLEEAARRGFGCVVVLGHPEYYSRFGFARASESGLGNEYGADEAFMAVALRPGGFPPDGGLVRYAPEFNALV